MQVQSIGLGVIPQPVDDDKSGPEVESVYIPGPRGYRGGGAAGSNFAGDWDMSIGAGGGGAVMANDYNATRTATTIMASSTIVGAGTYRFAGSSSAAVVVDNPDAADNPCVIALTDLAHKSAAGDGICVVAICNSGATSNDLLALFNGETPANPVYGAAIQADCYADQVRLVGFAGTALDTSNAWQAADYVVLSGIHGIRYYYDTGTAASFWYGADDFVVDVAAIAAAGQQLRVWAFCLPQSDTVNPTGFNYFLYDVGMTPHPAFPLVSDAVLPDGATDGNWYRVTGAGTFAGVDTVIGDYVKLIDGMTDIIAVHYGADGAQGDPGPAGADGASAYDVAVANGFIGNEAAWLASLVGATGPAGATGATGAPGTAATIAVGTVTTGTAGSAASITNVGTSSAAIFNFTIPRGDTGAGGGGAVTISGKTGAYTVVAGDLGTVINCTANTFTVSLTAAATLGAGFHCWVWNTSNTSSHVITIDPNSTETIDGATTLLLRRGEGCQIVCDGSNWQTGGLKKYRLYSENAANNAARPVASGSNAVSIGVSSQSTGTSSVALGDSALATGTSSIAIGTGRAATQNSVAIAITDSTTTYGAKTSNNAVAISRFAVASGAYSVVIGGNMGTASGQSSVVVGGDGCSATGMSSCTIGGAASSATGGYSGIFAGNSCQTTENYSVVIGGIHARSNVQAKIVYGQATATLLGALQSGMLTLARSTAGNTPTVLTSDQNIQASNNQLLLENNQSMTFRGQVVAQRKGSESTTSTAGWEFKGVIRRGANAASTALVAAVTPTLIAADTDAAAWTIAVTADTAYGALAVTVTGDSGKNIRWVCTLHSTEIIYP